LLFCFLDLRANLNRQQLWQIVEVTPASRVAASLGAFFADTAVLLLLLSVMGLAGWLMVWFVLAALRRLVQSFSLTRRAIGDVLFFLFWLFSLFAPLMAHSAVNTYRANLWDFGVSILPLSHFGNGCKV
jgi:hypothetical protein